LAYAYYRKGYDLYWKKQDYKEGGVLFEEAYANDPNIKGLNYSLGDYYRSINRLQDAVDAYRQEIDNDPTNTVAQQELDRTLSAMGRSK
jgi:tetratricopeptide (TPR) repeat protein